VATAEDYAKGRLKTGLSREKVIAKYCTQYPDMKAYVDDHVARKICLFGICELRKRREKRLRAVEAKRSSAPPKFGKYPEMEWMAPFMAKPVIVPPLGRPLLPPPWGIPPDDLERALEALPHEPSAGRQRQCNDQCTRLRNRVARQALDLVLGGSGGASPFHARSRVQDDRWVGSGNACMA
jgi:hypothetical protein